MWPAPWPWPPFAAAAAAVVVVAELLAAGLRGSAGCEV